MMLGGTDSYICYEVLLGKNEAGTSVNQKVADSQTVRV